MVSRAQKTVRLNSPGDVQISWVFDPENKSCPLYADLDPNVPEMLEIIEEHAVEYHKDEVGEVWVVRLNDLPGGDEFTSCGLLPKDHFMAYQKFFEMAEPTQEDAAVKAPPEEFPTD